MVANVKTVALPQAKTIQSTSRVTTNHIDFLKLLVTKLSNQNPLDVEKQEDFLGQLAQFESLNQIIKLNKNIETFSAFQRLSQSASLIGKLVEIEDGEVSTMGIVKAVRMVDGDYMILVNDRLVDFNRVKGVYSDDTRTRL